MPTVAQPPRFPLVARAGLMAHNARCRPRAPVTLPGPDGAMLLRLEAGAAPPQPAFRVRGTVGAGTFTLFMPAALAEAVAHGFADGLDLAAMEGELLALVLEAALLDVAAFVEGLDEGCGEGGVVLREAGPWDGAVEGEGLVLEAGGVDWPLRLQAPPALRERMLAAWPVRAMDLDALPAGVAVRLGGVVLGLGVVGSLRPGDVLLGAPPLERDAAQLVLLNGSAAGMVRVGGDWMLTGVPETVTEDADKDAEDEVGAGMAAEEGVDDIPVRLGFDLGGVEVSFAQLRTMGAGTVIDLGRGVGEEVVILANGRRIGRGELVDIEGSLGVRVTRINGLG